MAVKEPRKVIFKLISQECGWEAAPKMPRKNFPGERRASIENWKKSRVIDCKWESTEMRLVRYAGEGKRA